MKEYVHLLLGLTFFTLSCTGDNYRPENEEINEVYSDVEFYYLDPEFDYLDGLCESKENTPVIVGHTDKLKIGEWSPSNEFVWTKEYKEGQAMDLISCKDNGFLIFGRTSIPFITNGSFDQYLARTNSDGSIIWEKTYGGIEPDNISDAIEIDDGGFIFVGNIGKSTGGILDSLNIRRIDENGIEIWSYKSKTFSQKGWSICPADSDHFFVLGTGVETNTTYGYTNVMKIDLDGNILWSRHLDGTSIIEGHLDKSDIMKTPDGGCIIAIYSDNESDDFWVFKYSSSGELLWELEFGGSRYDHFIAIEQAANGYYYIAGKTVSHGTGGFDFILVKLDEEGNKIWAKTYGTEISEVAQDMEIIDSDIFVIGTQYDFDENESRPILLITNLEGMPN